MTKELLGRNLGFINALKFILIVCTMYTVFTHDMMVVAIIAEPRTLTHQRNLLILKALNTFHFLRAGLFSPDLIYAIRQSNKWSDTKRQLSSRPETGGGFIARWAGRHVACRGYLTLARSAREHS